MGPFAVKTGQVVYVNDPGLVLAPLDVHGALDRVSTRRSSEVGLRFHLQYTDPLFHIQTGFNADGPTELFATASTALFGADPNAPVPVDGTSPIRFGHGEGVRLVRAPDNPLGCKPYARTFAGDAVFVYRGECTFLEKLVHARRAGASGVVVISDEDLHINPSAEAADLDGVEELVSDAVAVVLRRPVGEAVTAMMAAAEERGVGQVVVQVEPDVQDVRPLTEQYPDENIPEADMGVDVDVETDENAPRDVVRMLYINGHPLVNTRLLV